MWVFCFQKNHKFPCITIVFPVPSTDMDIDADTHDDHEDDLLSTEAFKRPRLKSIEFVPVSLKGLRFGQRNIVNNNIRKLMVPFQYGFEHSDKLISQSKVNKRWLSIN